MKNTNILFPYPVISEMNNDYLDSVFISDHTIIEKGFNSRNLKVNFTIIDEIIENMIERDYLKIVLHVECRRTTFRKSFIVKDKTIEIPIDLENMANIVRVSGLLVANKDIEEYKNKNINKDYFGEDYIIKDLKKGSILGVTKYQEIKIDKIKDLFEDIPSIIKVGSTKKTFMEVNTDSETIILKLPEKDYKNYLILGRTSYSNIILSAVILPALVYILDSISRNEIEDIDKTLNWYQVIENKLSQKDIEIEDINRKHTSLEIAQMILESPLERGLENIKRILEREED